MKQYYSSEQKKLSTKVKEGPLQGKDKKMDKIFNKMCAGYLGTAPSTIRLAFCLLFPITAFFMSLYGQTDRKSDMITD